jgi:hypothetical protein
LPKGDLTVTPQDKDIGIGHPHEFYPAVVRLRGFILARRLRTNQYHPRLCASGDHVTIGLGGIVRTARSEAALKPGDLTIALTDANSQQFTLESRYLFKTYADHSAQLNTFAFDGINALVGLNGMVPYDGGWMVVVPSMHNPYVQLNYNVVPSGDGTGTILVTLLNPAGFKTLATTAPNSSYLSDLSVRLNYFSTGTPAVAKDNFSIDTFNSDYVGMNGAVLPGVTPVLTHAVDF